MGDASGIVPINGPRAMTSRAHNPALTRAGIGGGGGVAAQVKQSSRDCFFCLEFVLKIKLVLKPSLTFKHVFVTLRYVSCSRGEISLFYCVSVECNVVPARI